MKYFTPDLYLRFNSKDRTITAKAVLATQKESTVFLLVYTLAKEPQILDPKPHWRFSKKHVHWLYDEFDVDSQGNQQHEVLLSNGKIIKLRFRDVQLMTDKQVLDVA